MLAGHVDRGGRPRAFGRVYELQPGDEVDLVDANGFWPLDASFQDDIRSVVGASIDEL